MLTLVIGGARSGKSRFAQSQPGASQRVAYLATCRPEDDEMSERVARHRQDRSPHWTTFEEPIEIAHVIERAAADFDYVILDCLTLWLSNVFWARQVSPETLEATVSTEISRVARAAARTHLVTVTNELGCGLVPESEVGRRFRDVHGWMNQEVARVADRVFWVVAGIAVPVKELETCK